MATSRLAPQLHPTLLSRMAEARARTDAVLQMVPDSSVYDRPVPERHRLIFYLGHLEAFDWNLFGPVLALKSREPELDKLFAFGIDPIGDGLPTDTPDDWPSISRVQNYNQGVRTALDDALYAAGEAGSSVREIADGTLLNVAIEHRLMHAETLAYLLHNLPVGRKIAQGATLADLRPAPSPRQIAISAGIATLGQSRDLPDGFGWDNEFGSHQIEVPGFSVDAFPVTNHEYLKFVRAGGYLESSYWKPEDWEWKQRSGLAHPHFWKPRLNSFVAEPVTEWDFRAMFGTIPLPPSCPVYVTYAEASAFARWSGRKLPTEAQWHRAAYGAPDGSERPFPWGEAPPDWTRGNFHHQRWDPTPVAAHPSGASAFGVSDLIGNGWEWTSTEFGPLPGFESFPFYPGYSADFFDGKHFVMKGGSPRTDQSMLRRSFRNWFQPHYPHVYATFRCVEE
ncbi:MAG TPA: SUMF1/EgtB/PvdO family nonheme iron enzyme [Candidatus Cybelea sp.]|nr:SUMF1/EgtB/PvdO family nonheme iron enzyme [Candidatus Cybelea sp.]